MFQESMQVMFCSNSIEIAQGKAQHSELSMIPEWLSRHIDWIFKHVFNINRAIDGAQVVPQVSNVS